MLALELLAQHVDFNPTLKPVVGPRFHVVGEFPLVVEVCFVLHFKPL